jgi:primary-amine oxidase
MKPDRSSLFSKALVFILLLAARALAQSDAHPLDPLTKEEIAAASETLRAAGKVTPEMRFQTIVLHEPSKQEVLNYRAGQPCRREAFAVIYERAANKTYEAIVDVKNRAVISWKEISGAQPSMMIDDVLLTSSIVRQNPEWQAAISKRGIADFNEVQIEPWSAGNFGFAGEEGKRIVRAISFLRGKSRNAHARPIEGVIAYVDLSAKRVIRLVDAGVVPIPKATADLDMASIGKMRESARGLQILQKDGPGFEVRGQEIRWQNWRFRFALHPREGLVLYTVSYNDAGRERSVLYRASLSEMVVPYGDPSAGWFFRNAFDAGEFGIGRLVASLEPGVDFPENAVLFNAIFSNEGGGATEAPRAVALYERDGVVLWKHVDYMTGHNESRRSRQLVLSYYANVGNYEYGFNWVFHQDGALELEAMLTGIMAVKAVDAANAHRSHGHLVAEGVEAVHHQHIFNFRLDLDVDGTENSVIEMNTESLPPGPRNPYNNAFTVKETVLKREMEAQRQLNFASGRRWKVINPSVKNRLGQPVGYMLFPGENSLPYVGLNSQVRKRAAFMNAHLWATQHAKDEMNAAGFYINQSKGGEGLPQWTRANRWLENRDVVLWYTMGTTHIPRPEEWPVMAVHKMGFKLLPNGFFARNPSLDVPKP